jgi:uncharacterized protein
MAEDLEARLIGILRSAPGLMQVLDTVKDLALPDWLIFSGAVYQPVLNHLTGRPIEHGIKDYDVGYFDAADISYEAEDVVIQRVAAAFEPPLREMVEVRNQARVHVWFEDHFGEPYDALSSTTDALNRFVSPLFAVGVRMETDGRLTVVAPFGLEDLFALRLRPNPGRDTPHYNRVSEALQRRWPELTIEP